MMNRDPKKRTGLKASIVAEHPEEPAHGVIYRMDSEMIALGCPGCGHVSGMRVGNPKPPHSPSWEMSGEMPTITLSPSINCVGCCGWHGWLRNGVFESC